MATFDLLTAAFLDGMAKGLVNDRCEVIVKSSDGSELQKPCFV